MGDAENALPPSKKRAAGRELTRDTPIDDEEEDAPELEAGTFKRASEEVLATRRIVKVRRQPTNSASSANPFAGIRLVAPTEPSANPAETTAEVQSAGENTVADDSKSSEGIAKDSEKAGDGETKQSDNKTDEMEDKPAESKEAAEESNADKEHTAEKVSTDDKSVVDKEQSKDVSESENEDRKDAAHDESASKLDKEQIGDIKDSEKDNKNENSDNVDEKDNKTESAKPGAEGGHLKSFQLLSSSQNAFTGLAGTGFSTSSFSFGPISNEGSGSIFVLKNDKPFGLGLSTNGNSILGASGASAIPKNEGSGFGAKQEVVVETGEENEKVIFNADSVLFEFADGSWKERGKGEVKVNVSSETKKARLLMRSRGNFRLILNARLYPDMKLTNMDKKGVTFACINSASEGKSGLSTFALKFKDGSIVEEFKAAVTAHKGETSAVLKTPENSPKASDD